MALTPSEKQDARGDPTKDLVRVRFVPARSRAAKRSGNSPATSVVRSLPTDDAMARERVRAPVEPTSALEYALLYVNRHPTPPSPIPPTTQPHVRLALRPELSRGARGCARVLLIRSRMTPRAQLDQAKAGLAHGRKPQPPVRRRERLAEEALGQWDSASAYAAEAVKLDPRALRASGRATEIALWRRDTAASRDCWTKWARGSGQPRVH